MDLVLREAAATDAPAIAALAGQLGYPADAETVRQRLVLLPSAEHAVAVAVLPPHGVLGWVETRVEESLLAGRRARILALVVDERVRRRGLGRLLLAWTNRWARARGCREMYLTTNVTREAAARFYEREGWSRRKTSHVYAKEPTAG